MTNEEAINELIAEIKIIAQALQEIRNCMSLLNARITALEAKVDESTMGQLSEEGSVNKEVEG